MAIKPLTDLDGSVSKGTKGTLVVGDASTPLPTGFYVVKALAGSSTLPTNSEVGSYFFGDSTITPAIGDDVLPITFTKLCDVQGATFSLATDELEVTTLCDEVKKYALGRTDLTGTINGITKIGITDQAGNIINKFIKIITQTDDLTSVTINEIDNSPLFLQLEINKESTTGENTAFYLLPVVLSSLEQGVAQGAAQTFTSSYRVTSDDDIEFVLFELEQPVV